MIEGDKEDLRRSKELNNKSESEGDWNVQDNEDGKDKSQKENLKLYDKYAD
jgi:hypothetical protein